MRHTIFTTVINESPTGRISKASAMPGAISLRKQKSCHWGRKFPGYSSSLETVWTFKVRSAAQTCCSEGVNGSQMGNEEDINVTIRKTLEIRCTKKRS